MIREHADLPLFAYTAPKFLTISGLNQLVRVTLEKKMDGVWVVGEVSNYRMPPSGHCYFTLKDDKSQISAVMFRRQGNGRVNLLCSRGAVSHLCRKTAWRF